MSIFHHASTVFLREFTPLVRNPLGLVFTMTQPLVFLLLFGPLLATTTEVGQGSPWQWFVPGILVMMGLFATAGAGYTMLTELNDGSLERMLVTPLNRAAMLAGKTLKEVASLLAQAVLIIVAVLPFGFTLHPLSTLAGLALLTVFGIGLGSLAFALAIAAKRQQEMFWAAHQFVLFPLVLLSGVLLPMEGAPAWMARLSKVNPVTYLVEAERSLFAGDFVTRPVLLGAIAALTVAALGLFLGTRAMRRASL